jgi:hypothetical protein
MKSHAYPDIPRRRFLRSFTLGSAMLAAAQSGAARAQVFALREVKAFPVWSPEGPANFARITKWKPDDAGGSFDLEILSKEISARDEGYLVTAKPLGDGVAEAVMHAHYGPVPAAGAAADPASPPGTSITYRVQVLARNVPGGPAGWNSAGDVRWNFTKDADKESSWFYGRNVSRHDVADL